MLKKNILIFIVLFFLNSCMQSTSMIGPAYSLVSSGNIIQASASIGANKIVENKTGMTTTQLVSEKIVKSKNSKRSRVNQKFLNLVNNNLKKTRLIFEKQKKINN